MRFSAAGKEYVLCVHDDHAPDWLDEIEGRPSWMFSAFKAYVVELPARTVLEDLIVYRNGDVSEYRSEHMASFRPGEWLVALFEEEDALQAKIDARSEEFRKQFEAERARKFS